MYIQQLRERRKQRRCISKVLESRQKTIDGAYKVSLQTADVRSQLFVYISLVAMRHYQNIFYIFRVHVLSACYVFMLYIRIITRLL